MRGLWCVLTLILLTIPHTWATPAADSILTFTSLPAEGLLLDGNWKYQAGDNPQWASPGLDDRTWQPLDPTQDIHDLEPLWQHPVGWLRMRFSVDSALRGQSLALLIVQTGASEIYLNGKLLLRMGRVSARPRETVARTLPRSQLVGLQLGNGPVQVIAVRFALQRNIPYIRFGGRLNPALQMRLNTVNAAAKKVEADNIDGYEYFRAGTFFILALLHLAFFWLYPVQRANLYFFLFAFCSMLGTVTINQAYKVPSLEVKMYLLISTTILSGVLNSFFYVAALYRTFELRRTILFWGLSTAFFLTLPVALWNPPGWAVVQFFLTLVIPFESVRIALLSWQKKRRQAKIVAGGAVSYLVFFVVFDLMAFRVLDAGPDWVYGYWVFNACFMSLPIAISLVLAHDFAFTSRDLGAKRVEVQELSEKTLRQEQEKRHLEELNEFKSRFFANISHELRTPLALIRGTVEKLQKKDDAASPRQGDYALIHRSAGKLMQMINQFLDLSRLESGKLELHPAPGELSSFLGRLAGSFASLFESRGIAYAYTAPLQPVWVAMDSAKLDHILSNLLSNAAKFTPVGGAVRFAAGFEPSSPTHGLLRVVVEDTGIGIAADDLERVFERFYQADSSATRPYEGSGIGLSLVKELVGLHGGEVKVVSTPGRGAAFTVEIPLVLTGPAEKVPPGETVPAGEAAAMSEALPLAAWEDTPPAPAAFPSVQVLVVEDHAELRQFITAALGEQYAVQGATNGLEGYRMALDGLPDLIISDVMMPGMDGFTLCERLKTDPRTSHIPVVLLTAKAGAEHKLAGLETGADDYLTKPFGLEELLLRVRNLLESRRRLREKYGRQVALNPKEIAVTSTDEQFLARTLSVMETQMANPDFDVETFSREVGMSRSQLHRKLVALTGQGPGDFIRTIRLKRAAVLLQSRAGNVSEVACRVGFANLPYFSKAFREHFGQTPSEYARGGETPAPAEATDPPDRRP